VGVYISWYLLIESYGPHKYPAWLSIENCFYVDDLFTDTNARTYTLLVIMDEQIYVLISHCVKKT